MARRPDVRVLAIAAVAVLVTAAAGVGLWRAATYDPPPPVIGPAGVPGSCAGVPLRATRELRGMWLTTVNNIDFPSRPGLSADQVKAEYRSWLELAVAQHHNAIFVHVRPSGDAFWPSPYAPWSQWLTGRQDGRSPGWDPLAFMVEEAHRRNLEFHAWFNPYRGDQPAPAGPGADLRKLAPNHPLRAHPDWAVAYPTGKTGRLYFDPGNPAARAFVEDAILDAVRRYDVDGVHFDDFFYPYPEQGQDFPDAASYARYGRAGQGRADWRRANVDALVHEMSVRIKQVKPWVKFTISPFGIWRNSAHDPAGSATRGLESYDAIYADTRRWVREGWVDAIVPQLYWAIGFAKADYPAVLAWWAALVKGTRVQLWIGQGDYRIGEPGAWSDPAQLDRQLTLNDRYAVAGSVHFSAKQLRADRLGAVTRYRSRHYAAAALVPPMPALPVTRPGAPLLVEAKRAAGGGVSVDWRPGLGPAPVSWALYRVNGHAATLASTGRVGTPVTAPGPGTYCLRGLDRSGNEGAASAPITG